MSNLIPEITLLDGMEIFCLHKQEVPILYGQVQEYLRNGIELLDENPSEDECIHF